MRWLKNMISVGLLLAAAAVALVTVLSDHTDDYGQVPLPQGGVVQLPEGKVIVFFHQLGDGSNPVRQISAPITLRVVPAGGGDPVPLTTENGATGGVSVQRSETIGELGSIARLDVPAAGSYVVGGSSDLPSGTSFLEFGTNAGAAVLNRWRLLAALVGGALLLGLVPIPRPPRRWEDEGSGPTGWSSDPRAPYAG